MGDRTTIDTGRNEVDIDLEKYTEMVLKLDDAQDQIRDMERATKELKIATAGAQPREKFSFGALFRDENDINEKAIIGFADLITAFWDMDLKVSDTIYTSFVVVTLGSFGISEAGKAFGKN